MTQRTKRILPPESWYLPAEDRNARRRAQRRMEQQRLAEARRRAAINQINSADD
jgi:hypothetical protein